VLTLLAGLLVRAVAVLLGLTRAVLDKLGPEWPPTPPTSERPGKAVALLYTADAAQLAAFDTCAVF